MIDGLGERMRIALKAKKTSITDCAKATGIAKTTVANYVNSGCDPTATKLLKIAKYLGVSTDWLMGLSNDMYSDKAKPEKPRKAMATKTRIIERTVYITPNMTEKDKINFVAEYLGLTREAVGALHSSRNYRFVWERSNLL